LPDTVDHSKGYQESDAETPRGPFIGPEDPVFAVPEHGKTVLNDLIGGHANCTRFDQRKNTARDLIHHHGMELGRQVNGALDFTAGRSG